MADVKIEVARDRLRAVLAAYGADPARWAEGDRELVSLLATPDGNLDALLSDARTIDLVLAQASHPVAPPGAAERLSGRIDDGPGKVVSLGDRRRPRPQGQASLPRRLAVFTALAASLAFGIYLGASGRSDWLTPPLLAEESPEYLSAELDLLVGTLQVFEDNMEP